MAETKMLYRLGQTGADDVKGAIRSIGDEGEAVEKRLAAAAERKAARVAQIEQMLTAAQVDQQRAREKQAGFTTGGMAGLEAVEQQRRQQAIAAQAARELAAEQAQLEQRTRAFLSVLDPAWAAQQRFNGEMAEARSLISAGAITLDQYCDKLRMERAALDQATAAEGRHGVSMNQRRAGLQQLGFQLNDVAVQFASGTPPAIIFGQQIGQVTQAVGMLSNKTTGLVGFLGGPWGIALSVGMVALSPFVAELFKGEEGAEKAEAALKAFGDRQRDIANFIDETTGALKEQNRTLVTNAILTREADIAANNSKITKARDAVIGAARDQSRGSGLIQALINPALAGVGIDRDVERAIASANGDVEKLQNAIVNLARTTRPDLLGLARNITGIGAEAVLAARDNESLRRELRALGGDQTALANGSTALIEARVAERTATNALERAQARLSEVRRRGADIEKLTGDARSRALRQYEADLTSATRAVKAAQAAEQQARKGRSHWTPGEVDAALRGIGANVTSGYRTPERNAAVGGSKNSYHLHDLARDIAKTPGMTLEKIRNALSGAGIRELIDEGDHFHVAWGSKATSGLKGTVDAANEAAQALQKLKMEVLGLEKALDPQAAAARELKEQLDGIARGAAGGIVDAKTAADWTFAAKAAASGKRLGDLIGSSLDDDAAAEQKASERAKAFAQSEAEHRDRMKLIAEEARLIGANDNVAGGRLRVLELKLQLQRENNGELSKEGAIAVANAAEEERALARVEALRNDMDELRGTGEQFLDTVLDPEGWNSWGDLGKKVLNDLKAEFIKLALLNPIKNMLFGQDNPTLSSVGSLIGGLLGGGRMDNVAKTVAGLSDPASNAVGTHHFSGGATWIAENGPELVTLPMGTKITPAAETRRMMAANDDRPREVHVHQHFDNNFAGGAATMKDVEQMGQIAYTGAIAAVRDADRRRA